MVICINGITLCAFSFFVWLLSLRAVLGADICSLLLLNCVRYANPPLTDVWASRHILGLGCHLARILLASCTCTSSCRVRGDARVQVHACVQLPSLSLLERHRGRTCVSLSIGLWSASQKSPCSESPRDPAPLLLLFLQGCLGSSGPRESLPAVGLPDPAGCERDCVACACHKPEERQVF